MKIKALAEKIIDYSLEVRKNEKVVIQMTGEKSKPLVEELLKELNKKGAETTIINMEPKITAEIIKEITVEKAKIMADRDLKILNEADVCIMLKSIEDDSAMKHISKEKLNTYLEHYTKPINKAILETTRWISLRYPNKSMANRAGMNLKEFEEYYFKVCNMDYKVMSNAMNKLVKLMEKTEKVHIMGVDTDIEFSIKDMPVHKCDGTINLPDGEVYTAPIRESVKGKIRYNIPTVYNGFEFEWICFEFREGKIVSAKCKDDSKNGALEDILNTDSGARYIGEFALGVNPYVIYPTKDILFDEKIAGSFHLTPGFSYKNAFNGNESAIHWDLVCIQREMYGGGEIYFDDQLIRKDGFFIDKELSVLNPMIK